MTNKQKINEFRNIVMSMADLYAKKNANYGDSFGQLYQKLGPIAGLVPLHNKLDRATNLITGGKNDFESLEDTLKDLACYAIMNLIELKNKDNKAIYVNRNTYIQPYIQLSTKDWAEDWPGEFIITCQTDNDANSNSFYDLWKRDNNLIDNNLVTDDYKIDFNPIDITTYHSKECYNTNYTEGEAK